MIMAVLLAADLTMTSHGTIVLCREHKPVDNDWWSWRLVESRKCWYRGRPGKPKDELRWPETAKKGVEPATAAPSGGLTPELGEFERRWRDLIIELTTRGLLDPRPMRWR
jgi:hypothetical protein